MKSINYHHSHHPRAIIADDEEHLLEHLASQLQRAWPELQIIAKAPNGLEALRLIDEHAPEVVFLDIRMPGLTGLDVAKRLASSERAPHIVFITAYDQYAVDAFEHCAIDYLLKPPSQERIDKAVIKLKTALRDKAATLPVDALQSLLQQMSQHALPVPVVRQSLQWIRAAQGGETRLIAIDEVIYFQSNDKYTSVFTQDGESLIRTPLSELRDQLDSEKFWQIHRSTVVAVKQIASTKLDFRGRLMVNLKARSEQLVVSRNYLALFKQM